MELLALNEKSKAPLSERRLSIQFVCSSPVRFRIKSVEKISTQNNFVDLHAAGAWLNINPAMPISRSKPVEAATSFGGLPFNTLKSQTMNKQSNATPLTSEKESAKKRAKRPVSAQHEGVTEANVALSGKRLEMKFILDAPTAHLVKLAADFTQWEKSPLEMTKSENGLWQAVVPLPPGNYSYRFIVDGHWCDDPRSTKKVANPFGTTNSVVCVSPR